MTMNQEITLSEAGAVPYQSLQASYLLQCLVCSPYLLNVCRTHILYKTGVPDSSCHPSSASSPCLGDSTLLKAAHRPHTLCPVPTLFSSHFLSITCIFFFISLLIYNIFYSCHQNAGFVELEKLVFYLLFHHKTVTGTCQLPHKYLPNEGIYFWMKIQVFEIRV